MDCEICKDKFDENLIYQNDKIKILLGLEPATNGHLQIFPVEHYSILEEIPIDLLSYMAVAANKISMVLFELLKVHGTNIIIQNGLPAGQSVQHFSINIIPRRTDDGLKLDWDLKQASPESLESMHRIISEGISIKHTGSKNAVIQPSKEQTVEQENAKKSSEDSEKEKKINYFLKSLERLP